MLKRILFLILFLSSPLLAQYTSADFELARTTFERKFEPGIVNKYLHSEFPANIKAALLSLSNSQDTSFIREIIKVDYSKFGDYAAFALGQAGPSIESEKFLLKKILSNSNPGFQRYNYEALGRCAGKNSLMAIINSYFSDKTLNAEGISLAVANFAQRNIKSEDLSEEKILLKEILTENIPVKRRIDAAFAASRIGIDKSHRNELLRVLFEKTTDENNLILKHYIMACLRKIKISPESPEQIRFLITHNDWRIRNEAAKLLVYHNFGSTDELKAFLALLNDRNPNVSRQAAISLRDINLDSSMVFLLKDELKKKLQDNSLSSNTKGELFISYCRFSPDEIFILAEKLKTSLKPIFIYRALSENQSSPQKKLSYLLKGSSSADKAEKLEILSALLPLQNQLRENAQLIEYLLTNLSSNFPAGVSIVADGIDSLFIESHKDELKKIVTRQVHLNQNNANFTESNMSLVNLSEKISPELRNDMLMVLRGSKLYSMQSFACKELGKPFNISKSLNNFYDIWGNAFKYGSARITTNKGSFLIKFSAESAPVSVGNFCKLVQEGFFNNVIFHRVVPNFVIQTGDPDGTGWGGPGYDIVTEFNLIPFDRSFVGMASAGKDTEGSQWFVMHNSFPHLNGRYSNFGKVTEGMETVDQVDQGDTITKIELLK